MATNIDNNKRPAFTNTAPLETPKTEEAQTAGGDEGAEDIGVLRSIGSAFLDNAVDTALGGPMNPFKTALAVHDAFGSAVDATKVAIAASDAKGAIAKMSPGASVEVKLQEKATLVGGEELAAGALRDASVNVARNEDGYDVTSSFAQGVYGSAEAGHFGVEVKDVLRTTIVNKADSAASAAALVNTTELAAVAHATRIPDLEGGYMGDSQKAALMKSASSVTLEGTYTAEGAAKMGLGELFGTELDAEGKVGGSVTVAARVDAESKKLVIERRAAVEGGVEPNIGTKKKVFEAEVVEKVELDLPKGFDMSKADDLTALIGAARNSPTRSPVSTTIALGSDGVDGELTFSPARAKDALKMLAGGAVPPGVTTSGEVKKLRTSTEIAKAPAGHLEGELELSTSQVLSTREVDDVASFRKALLAASTSVSIADRIGR